MTVVTVKYGNNQRVSKSALSLVAEDLLGRYEPKELKQLLSAVPIAAEELSGRMTKEKLFNLLAYKSTNGNVPHFLRLLEHITSPLLFSGNSEEGDRVLKYYTDLMSRENFQYEDGRWYVGPSKEEEKASIAADFYYWRDSDGNELEPSVQVTEKRDYYVTLGSDGRSYYYNNELIKWNFHDDIYKAFHTLFHSVNGQGFVGYEDYEREFKKLYPQDYKKRKDDLRGWILKNLTEKGGGILRKTGHENLVQSVRKRGLQFNNVKLP